MREATYGITVDLGSISLEAAEEKVTTALKAEGFGVLTEIDVKETLKKKIGADFREYKILGACNPGLAHRALSGDPMVGLLLPCNVIIFKEDDGTAVASFAKPSEMFKIVENSTMKELVDEVGAKISRAAASLS